MSTVSETSSAFKKILGWSNGSLNANCIPWPIWQRDALRRIIKSDALLPTTDLDELENICRSSNGIGTSSNTIPLAETDIPVGLDSSTTVCLARLGSLKNVNRITGDPPLDFGPFPGLTIVFGDNGAGKSGYARVIKKACRARGTPPTIVPDIYQSLTNEPAACNIEYTRDNTLFSINWVDGKNTDPLLTSIFVFDSASAQHHVNEDATASFTPHGLDILPRLAKACDELKNRFKIEIEGIKSSYSAISSVWKYSPATRVGKVLSHLSDSTDIEDVKSAAEFIESDRIRLTELQAALRSDPKAKSEATKASSGRIRSFAESLSKIALLLSETKMQQYKTLSADTIAARNVTALVMTEFEGSDFLPGTGGAAWRKLWEIARNYSAEAYPGDSFPVTKSDARCVLCQQSLDKDACDRFMRFDKYVKSESRREQERLETLITDNITELKSIKSIEQ